MNNYQKAGKKITLALITGLIIIGILLTIFFDYYFWVLTNHFSIFYLFNTIIFYSSWLIFFIASTYLFKFLNLFSKGHVYSKDSLLLLNKIWWSSLFFILLFIPSLYNNPLFGNDIVIFLTGFIAVSFSWTIFTVIVLAIKTIIYNVIELKDEVDLYI